MDAAAVIAAAEAASHLVADEVVSVTAVDEAADEAVLVIVVVAVVAGEHLVEAVEPREVEGVVAEEVPVVEPRSLSNPIATPVSSSPVARKTCLSLRT